MAVGVMREGEKPRVELHKGNIAIWAGDNEDPSGLLISAGAAIDTGLACLVLAAQQQNAPINLNAAGIELESAEPASEDIAARLIVTAEGAPLAILLSAQQLVDMAAAMAALAREMG